MINTFLYSTRVTSLKSFQRVPGQAFINRLASFTSRHILQENSDETGTLLTRFAKHVAISLRKEAPAPPRLIRYVDFFPITDVSYLKKELARIAANQMPTVIIYASVYRSNADPSKFAILLNEIDATALRLLPNMDIDTVLETLYALFFLIPNWIVQTDFYNAATKHITTIEFDEHIPKEKFLQICFYLGLNKSRNAFIAESFNKLLNRYINSFLPKMSTLDFVLIANAAFKTSVRIDSDLYNQRLMEELQMLSLQDPSNDGILITLIKSMRLQRIQSKEMCEYLKYNCISVSTIIDRLQLRGCIHLFAFFADNLWDDNDTVTNLVNHCLQRIIPLKKFNIPRNEEVRCKDLATFLWCCAQLNCKLADHNLKQIETVVMEKICQNEFRYFADQLVDICLMLWILGHKSRKLIEVTINVKTRAQNKVKNDQRDHPKVESRFQVLLSAIAIEEPTWNLKHFKTYSTPKIETPAPPYLLKSRSEFVSIKNKIQEFPNVDTAELVCPVIGINIPSILISHKDPDNNKMFLELLYEEQQLKCSRSSIGIIRLKIHLLESMGYKVNVLNLAQYESGKISLGDLLHYSEVKDASII